MASCQLAKGIENTLLGYRTHLAIDTQVMEKILVAMYRTIVDFRPCMRYSYERTQKFKETRQKIMIG